MRLLCTSALIVGGIAASGASICLAQDAQPQVDSGSLEEVIVTAERREVDVQKAATSVSVRGGQELQSQGRYTPRQILEDVPGVTAVDVANTNIGGNDILGNNITIRGITPNSPGGAGPGVVSPPPPTAVYVDDIYEGIGSQYDIERVEINRGPQGTLYGRSATSGVYAVHTLDPTMDAVKGNASIEVGNYSLQHYSAALNIPAGDRFAVRLAADQYHQGEGYYNGPGGERRKTDARIKMLYRPTDDLSILVGAALEDNETHTGYNSLITPTVGALGAYVGSFVPTLAGENKHRQVWTQISWNLGVAKLTYLGAWRTWKQDDDQFVGQFTAAPPTYIDEHIVTPFDQFITHELRLASNKASRLVWQTGVSYYDNRVRNTNNNELLPNVGAAPPPPANLIAVTLTEKATEAYGIFGEATYSFTDATRMTAGARYDRTSIKVNLFNEANLNFPVPILPPPAIAALSSGEISRDFNNVTYKLRVEHDLAPSNLLYASVSSGFVPGDLNISKVGGPPTPTPASLILNSVAPETLTSYEIGSKNRFLNNSFQLNAGVFYYRYGGFQTSYQANAFDPSSSVPVTIPARNFGGELEVLWQITTSDRLGLNYNYVVSKWADKPAAFAAIYPSDDRSQTPPHNANANYQHVFRLYGGSSLSARIDGRWQSSYSRNLDTRAVPAFAVYRNVESRLVGDIDASWQSNNDHLSVTAYVRNFTNRRYFVYSPLTTLVNVGFTDPRTYGATLSVRF